MDKIKFTRMKDTLSVKVRILNAFVDGNRGGNPAGVVLDADGLTNEEKLRIAAKVGLSETAFVSASTTADFKLDFFTPIRQIPHCGHATIATFSYLARLGKINGIHSSKETIDGNREILLDGDLAFMEQKPPLYTDAGPDINPILASLGLSEHDILPHGPVTVVNTGNAFAIIPVRDQSALEKIVPDFDAITRISDRYDLIGYYVFCTQTDDPERDANSRMFGPRYGIPEEAGTGMAAGPLACYLFDILGVKKEQFLIQQGWFMQPPSPSLIQVNLHLDKDKITKVMAGGKGKEMQTLEIML